MKTNATKTLRAIFLCASLAILLSNATALYKTYRLALVKMQVRLPLEPGIEFKEFKNWLYHVKKAGFLTDKDMSPEKNDGQFLAAQYMLAPTVLDLHNVSAKWVILDYKSALLAYQKIREMDAVIVAKTAYGKILVRK